MAKFPHKEHKDWQLGRLAITRVREFKSDRRTMRRKIRLRVNVTELPVTFEDFNIKELYDLLSEIIAYPEKKKHLISLPSGFYKVQVYHDETDLTEDED